jgi:hypothetical protein
MQQLVAMEVEVALDIPDNIPLDGEFLQHDINPNDLPKDEEETSKILKMLIKLLWLMK